MLSPISWIKPRLKSLCVAFGAADMTLIILSTICWAFFFNVGFEAQHLHTLYNEHNKKSVLEEDEDDDDAEVIYKLKEERTPEELRLERTIRACGLHVTNKDLDTNSIDANYAGPAAFIGASMGSFFILGALLCALNVVDHPAARRVVCAVALFGESVSCFFLLIGVITLLSNDGLCPTEYYYEYFQPVMYLVVFSIIFISTYKAYEMTILALYMGDQSSELNQERKTIKRLSGGGTGTLESDLKKLKLSVQAQAGQGDSSKPRRRSANTNNNYGEGDEGEEDAERMESRGRRRSRDNDEATRRPQTPTDNSSRDPDESRRRRRKSREEAEMKQQRPDTATATATDNSTRNPGGESKKRSRDRGDGSSEPKRRSHSRDREEGRSGERSKGRGGPGGDDESELRRRQKAMEYERAKRQNAEGGSDRRGMKPETPEGQKDASEHRHRRKHTTLNDKEKPQHRSDRAEYHRKKKERQSEDYHRDWERETKKANRRHPANIPQDGGGEAGGLRKAVAVVPV